MPVLLAVLILLLSAPPSVSDADTLAARVPADRSGKELFDDCSAAGLMRVADDVVAAWNAGDGQRFAG